MPIAESSRASGAGKTNTSIVLSELGKEAWELLVFTESKVSNHPTLSGLFYDEMCISFIDKLAGAEKSFVDKFVERFSANVEGDYIEDVSPKPRHHSFFQRPQKIVSDNQTHEFSSKCNVVLSLSQSELTSQALMNSGMNAMGKAQMIL